ncbi:MAG: hypothetical protein K6343_02485 [Caldisericaceae bacterium]
MKKWMLGLIVGVMVFGIVASIFTATNAYAWGNPNEEFSGFGSRVQQAFKRGFRLGVEYGINQDVANFLGITLDQLRSEIKSGKTLAAIATEHGKTEQELINFIVAKEKAILDDALKTGKITQDRYNAMIANLEARVKERVETTAQFKARSRVKQAFKRGFRLGVEYGINQDVANFLGITLDQLRSEVKSGKTLAAIATEHGKTEQELIDFIVAKEKAILDDALKTGKITQDRYNAMIANLEARVKERVETTPHVGRP